MNKIRTATLIDSFATLMVAITLGLLIWNNDMRISETKEEIDRLEQKIEHVEQQQDSVETIIEKQDSLIARASRHGAPIDIAVEIEKAAREQGIPLRIAYRLIAVESAYRPKVVSGKGAVGLAQVKLSTARSYSEVEQRSDLFDVKTNLNAGFKYLKELKSTFGSWQLALQAYNAGPTRLRRAHRTGEYNGSSYAEKVMR